MSSTPSASVIALAISSCTPAQANATATFSASAPTTATAPCWWSKVLPYALLITNGEFTSFHGDDPTMVEVLDTNRGVVRFVNSAFWGPCNQIAKIAGQGTVGFSDCTFVQWKKDRAAIQASSGSVLIRGCEFRQDQPHISLGENVTRAVVSGNLFTGPAQIQNNTKDAQIGLNAAL
jgi:hypothetical protein